MERLGGGGGCRSDCIIFERVSETLKVGVIVVVIAIMMKTATVVELAEAVEVVKVKVKVACHVQLTAMFWFEILCTRPMSGASSNRFAASAMTCACISHKRHGMQLLHQTKKKEENKDAGITMNPFAIGSKKAINDKENYLKVEVVQKVSMRLKIIFK